MLNGCVTVELKAEGSLEKDIPILEAHEPVEDSVLDAVAECISRYGEWYFLEMNRGMYFHDGWIYYDKNSELRKCKPDLAEDTAVFPLEGRYFQVLNQEGFATMKVYTDESRKLGDDEVYILDVHNGQAERIDNLDTKYMIYRMLYKDFLIVVQETVIEGHGAATRLDLYDRQGNFIEIIAPDVNHTCFAAIDDSIYYLPYFGNEERTKPANTVMRYDLISRESEVVFTFDEITDPNSWSYAYFTGRTIIVPAKDAFVYTSIDEIVPQKILFNEIDKSGGRKGMNVVPSADKDIFFVSSHFGKVGDNEDEFLYSNVFRMDYETNELILLKEEWTNPLLGGGCFFDGYLYYFSFTDDGNYIGDLMREHFY